MTDIYKEIISPLMQLSGSAADIRVESSFPGTRQVGGKYSLTTNTITLYMDEIRRQCIQLFGSLDFLDRYIAVVFAHELGHAQDKALVTLAERLENTTNEFERLRLSFLIEKRAWNYAERLLIATDRNLMKKIIVYSLRYYYEELEHQQGA